MLLLLRWFPLKVSKGLPSPAPSLVPVAPDVASIVRRLTLIVRALVLCSAIGSDDDKVVSPEAHFTEEASGTSACAQYVRCPERDDATSLFTGRFA